MRMQKSMITIWPVVTQWWRPAVSARTAPKGSNSAAPTWSGTVMSQWWSGSPGIGVPEIHLKLASPNTDYEGLMITAVLVDVADNGEPFKAFKLKNRLDDRLPSRVIGEYEGAGYWGSNEILEYVQDSTAAKIISFGYTDLNNPGHGDEISEYTEIQELEAGKYYDYTFYMLPTVYTVAPGHTLQLILTT